MKIIELLKSNDIESCKLGISLLENSENYNMFKDLTYFLNSEDKFLYNTYCSIETYINRFHKEPNMQSILSFTVANILQSNHIDI